MFLTSKSPPCFPHLSLQISPPAAAATACITNSSSTTGSDLTQENTFNQHDHKSSATADHIPHHFDHTRLSLGLEMGALNHHHHHHHRPNINTPTLQPQGPQHHCYSLPEIYGHGFKRRSRMVRCVRRIRAPRMRWTSTLHDHFIHAVQLLGGHQRATPKSVQELMNVKDLTLAHVKSHLQMYRTVKSSDKGAAGQVISVSPPTALQSQRRSLFDSHYPMKENTSSDHCLSPFTNDSKADEVVTLDLSKKMKLSSSSSVASKKLLNLEFTLGIQQPD